MSTDVVDTVNEGRIHIEEVDLDGLVSGVVARGLLTASTEMAPADVFVIAVPTPFMADHQPDIGYVLAAATGIAAVLKPGDTVLPLHQISSKAGVAGLGERVVATRR